MLKNNLNRENWKLRLSLFIGLGLAFAGCFLGGNPRAFRKMGMPFSKSNFSFGKLPPRLKTVYVEGGIVPIGGKFGSKFGTIGYTNSKDMTVSGFFATNTFVTRRQYLAFLEHLISSRKASEYYSAIPSAIKRKYKSESALISAVRDYFHPRYHDYPVTGLSDQQASEFIKWLNYVEYSTVYAQEVAKKEKEKKKEELEAERKKALEEKKRLKAIEKEKSNKDSDSKKIDSIAGSTGSDSNNLSVDGSQIKNGNMQNVDSVSTLSSSSNNSDKKIESNESKEKKTDNSSGGDVTELGNDENLETIVKEHSNVLMNGDEKEFRVFRLPTYYETQLMIKSSHSSQTPDGIELTRLANTGRSDGGIRYREGGHKGKFIGLFKIAEGDYKGLQGSAQQTPGRHEPVDFRMPNDNGIVLYPGCRMMTSSLVTMVEGDPKNDHSSFCNEENLYNQEYKSKYLADSPLSSECFVTVGFSSSDYPEETSSMQKSGEGLDDVGLILVSEN